MAVRWIFMWSLFMLAAVSAQAADKPLTADELYGQAVQAWKEGKPVKAQTLLHHVRVDYPEYASKVKPILEKAALVQILREAGDGSLKTITVKKGDTLGGLAGTHRTTVDTLRALNRLDTNVIRIDQTLTVPDMQLYIRIDKSQNTLFLMTGERVLKAYRVSTGAGNITPVGSFTIETKLIDPVWYTEGAIVEPDSPENALGTRWMGFNKKGYGIHGTIHPESIGYQMSAGCIRMYNEEVEELYRLIPMKTSVKIVD